MSTMAMAKLGDLVSAKLASAAAKKAAAIEVHVAKSFPPATVFGGRGLPENFTAVFSRGRRIVKEPGERGGRGAKLVCVFKKS
jgi:predicted NBD/HSP70 family sugar kinase